VAVRIGRLGDGSSRGLGKAIGAIGRERATVALTVRDTSTLCDAVMRDSPEQVATALEPVQGALTAVAGSLAAHFGDWGAASRFTADQ
jgi:hypothetical protein